MPGEWIVAVFPSRAALTTALNELKHTKFVQIRRAAIVAKAETGEVVVVDDNIGADEGGIAGGTLGLAMAALGMVQMGALAIPGVGVMIVVTGAVVGALVGNVTARVGVSLLGMGDRQHETRFKKLADRLRAGHPALVMEVRDAHRASLLLTDALAKHGLEMIEPITEPATV